MLKDNNRFQFIGIHLLIIVYIFLLAFFIFISQNLLESSPLRLLISSLTIVFFVGIVYFVNSIYFTKCGLKYPETHLPFQNYLKNLLIGFFIGFIILLLPRLILFTLTGQIEYLRLKLSWEIFVFSLLPAVAEELIFRGTFLNFFLKKNRKYVGLIISTLLFGLVHLSNALVGQQMDISIMLNLVLGGFCLGLVYLNFGLLSAIGLHLVWNLMVRGFTLHAEDDFIVNIMIGAVCILLFILERKNDRAVLSSF